jgi:hypothetical protein
LDLKVFDGTTSDAAGLQPEIDRWSGADDGMTDGLMGEWALIQV